MTKNETIKDMITLDDCLIGIINGTTKTQNEEGAGYLVSRIETIQHAKFDVSRMKYIDNLTLEDFNKFKYQYGDIALSHINSYEHIGKTAIYENAPPDLVHGMNLLRLRPNTEKCLPRYIYWFMQSISFRSAVQSAVSHSVNQCSINQKKLKAIRLPLFPIGYQKKIVDKIERLFDEVDRGVENLKIVKSKLESYKQSVLNAAIHGKLVPQDPNDEPATVLLDKIKAEKESLVKAGKLKKEKPLPPINQYEIPFELPEGWEWVRLGQLSAGMTYGTSQKCGYDVPGTPILRIPNIANAKISFDDLKYTQLTVSDLKDLTLQQGDILIIRSNGSVNIVGRSAVFIRYSTNIGFAGYLIRFRPVLSDIDSSWIHFCLESVLLRSQIEEKAKSTSGVNNISAKELAELIIPLPPSNLMKKYTLDLNDKISAILDLKNNLDSQLRVAEQLKQSILRSAFEGKLI